MPSSDVEEPEAEVPEWAWLSPLEPLEWVEIPDPNDPFA